MESSGIHHSQLILLQYRTDSLFNKSVYLQGWRWWVWWAWWDKNIQNI